jgi:hypothetical protein
MEGIEAFTALETLNCSSNNFLNTLNVFENRALREISAFNCDITSLTLPDSNNLTYLSCGNNNLPGIDVSAYTNLEVLRCANNGSNDLGAMDFTTNTMLTELQVHNSGVTSLNLSSCTNLDYLTCFNNNSSANPNTIATLDISSNTALFHVRCYNVGMSTFTISASPYNNMIYLDCGSNSINSLDPTKFPNIETLWCYYNSISSLNLTNNMDLKSFDCGGNSSMTSVNLSMLPNLEKFWGYENNFSSLDASFNMKLKIFNGNSNPNLSTVILPDTNTLTDVYACCGDLTSIQFTSNHTNLDFVDVGINSLSGILDVGMLSGLTDFYCNGNQITTLNIANDNIDNFVIMRAQNNGANLCIQVDDVVKAGLKAFPNWQRDNGSSFSENCPALSIEEFNKELLSLYPNPTNNIMHLKLTTGADYFLINPLGKVVSKGELIAGENQINVTNLTNGIYFLKVKSILGDLTRKVLKK